jgi:hypothetical protein
MGLDEDGQELEELLGLPWDTSRIVGGFSNLIILALEPTSIFLVMTCSQHSKSDFT